MSNVNPGDMAKLVGCDQNSGRLVVVLHKAPPRNRKMLLTWMVQALQPMHNFLDGSEDPPGTKAPMEDKHLVRVDPPADEADTITTKELECQ